MTSLQQTQREVSARTVLVRSSAKNLDKYLKWGTSYYDIGECVQGDYGGWSESFWNS